MIKIEDFTKMELILAITGWIRNSNIQYSSPEIIAQQLEDGTWLDHYNKLIEDEVPHHNS